jgi:FkbM family methyltransferase
VAGNLCEGMVDYHRSRLGRRRSWWGLKGYVKRFAAMRLPHLALRAAARVRPRLRRGGRLPAPARLDEIEGQAGGASFVMLRPDRCIVAKELYWGRGRRPRLEDQLAVETIAAAAQRCDVAVDIGAYTGLFTLAVARANPSVRVHAFEIVPENCRALRDNCVRNGLLDRVSIHHAGIGTPGARMRVPAGTRGSALPDNYSSELSFDSGVEVRFVALDSLVDDVPDGARVIVKIDVEGTEVDVLRHGQRFLAELRPLILCEVLPDADAPALQALLEPHGYRFHLVGERGLLSKPMIRPDRRYRDWLFVPPDLGLRAAALDAAGVTLVAPR